MQVVLLCSIWSSTGKPKIHYTVCYCGLSFVHLLAMGHTRHTKPLTTFRFKVQWVAYNFADNNTLKNSS